MKKYEGMFLLDTSRCAKDWDKVVAHVEDILKKNGAEIGSSEKWGERKLAYAIGHHKRAVYLLVVFLCPGPAIGRIRRACQLSDAIIRVLFTVYDEKAQIAVEPDADGSSGGPSSADRARESRGKQEEKEKEAEAKEEDKEEDKEAVSDEGEPTDKSVEPSAEGAEVEVIEDEASAENDAPDGSPSGEGESTKEGA